MIIREKTGPKVSRKKGILKIREELNEIKTRRKKKKKTSVKPRVFFPFSKESVSSLTTGRDMGECKLPSGT